MYMEESSADRPYEAKEILQVPKQIASLDVKFFSSENFYDDKMITPS